MNCLREDIATVLVANRYRGDVLSIRVDSDRSASIVFDHESGLTHVAIYSHPCGGTELIVTPNFVFPESEVYE
jgi:hypothetical protein